MHIRYLVSGRFGHPDRKRPTDILTGKEGDVVEVDDERGPFLIGLGVAEEADSPDSNVEYPTEDFNPGLQEPEVEHEVIAAETIEEPPAPEVKPKRRGRKPGQKKKN
jgi:hypothetical protein